MTIKAYSYFDGVFVTNTSHSITGNDVGDFADSAMGVVAYVVKTSGYTAAESDEVIDVSSAVDVTITLPACASTRVGKRYTIRKLLDNSGVVNITPSGSDTMNGVTRISLVRIYHFVTLVNTGSAWMVIASQGWFSGLLYVCNTTNSFADTAAEASLGGLGSGATTLPAFFYKANSVLRVKARGYVSNTGTPTLTLKVKHGSTVLASTGAITTASGLSSTGWALDVTIVCRTTGASGTLMAQGEARIGSTFYPMVNTSATTVDLTASQAIDITGQWGTANPSNLIACAENTYHLER